MKDLVSSPKHYSGQGKIECIEVLEQLGLDFRLSNVIKYLWRFRYKGGKTDLLKAQWYLSRYINKLEEDENVETGNEDKGFRGRCSQEAQRYDQDLEAAREYWGWRENSDYQKV